MNSSSLRHHKILVICWVLALCLALVPTGIEASPARQDYTFQECDSLEEVALRDELNTITQQIFATESSDLSVAALVDREWRALNLDAVVDRQIDSAIDRVRSEEDYWSRFLSGWSAEKSEEFTSKVANYAFGSDVFRSKIDELSLSIADDLSAQMSAMSAKSASSALLCVQAFIGDNYSTTMVSLFKGEIQQKVEDLEYAAVDVDVTPILETHTRSLAGVGVIIGTQIAKRLAKKVAQRIAGKVVGRIVGKAATSLIPIAGWIIGGGLIVWDLVESGNGSLPQIQEGLKNEDVKAGIRGEITQTIRAELNKELPQLARDVSNDIYSTWLDFKQKYRQVLDLAAENSEFRHILNNTPVEEVYKLANLVTISTRTLGREDMIAAVDNGTFERVSTLPESAFVILPATGSMQRVVDWVDLAGSQIEDVVSLEIYKLKAPEDFSDRGALEAVIAIDDSERVAKLLLLQPQALDVLLTVPTDNLKILVDRFGVDDLTWLSGYLAEMEPARKNQLIGRLLDDPAVMGELKNRQVQELVVESQDVETALEFLSSIPKEAERPPVEAVIDDTNKLVRGAVPWQLFWRKYGTLRNLIWGLGALLLLTLAFRFLWRRNVPAQVIVNLSRERSDREREP